VDSSSALKLLVNTGSSFSILPHQSRAPLSSHYLQAADGRRIKCWGHKSIQLILDGVHYSWPFFLANVRYPILGIDFLRHFELMVDAAGGRLVPRQVAMSVSSVSASPAGQE
jgi:hypothetical protein